MDRVILVEVRDRRLHLRSRHRVEQLPASIGRAYDNDIIVDDRYMDAHHARLLLDADGVMVIEDTGSVNGVRDGMRGERSPRLRLPSGGTARLGETVLRVVDIGHAVAPAVPLSDENRLVSGLRRPGVAWTTIGGSLAFSAVVAWLKQYGADDAATAVGAAVAIFLFLALWAGTWALVGRAQGARARFLTHLAIAALALSLGTLWTAAMQYVEFIWPAAMARSLAQSAGLLLLLTVALSAHLSLVSMLSRRRRILTAAVTAVSLLILSRVNDWSSADDFDDALHYSDVLRPVGASMARTVSLDRFLEDAGNLQAELDALAEHHPVIPEVRAEAHSDTAP